jgi:hypothetical protein
MEQQTTKEHREMDELVQGINSRALFIRSKHAGLFDDVGGQDAWKDMLCKIQL